MDTTTQDKLQKIVNDLAEKCNLKGSAKLSTCDFYGWDKDVWMHRNAIMDALKKRGYIVESKKNFDVLDITVVKPITLM